MELVHYNVFSIGPCLAANIKLGWKCIVVSNTLTYYDTATIMDVKVLIVQARSYVGQAHLLFHNLISMGDSNIVKITWKNSLILSKIG